MRFFSKTLCIILLCAIGIGFTSCTPSDNKTDTVAPITGTVAEIEEYGHAVLDTAIEDFA